jgi:hypothetical protein
MQHRVVTDYSNVKGNETVKVFVRLRPPEDGSNVSKQHIKDLEKSNKITILDPRDQTSHTGNEHAFAFNEVFNVATNQESVFLQVSEPLVTQTLRGYNTCCFAYGQTGSGKTYSMFGPPGDDTVGIIPRAVNDVFQRLVQIQEDKETAVVVSFLEMYCDQIRDLGKAYLDKDTGAGDSGSRQTTADWYEENKRRQAGKYRPGSRGNSGSRNGSGRNTPSKKSVGISGTRFAPRGVGLATASEYVSQDLTIHEDSMGNVFVKDLSVIPVSTPEECLTVVQMGFKLRATHETKMNAVSSRSHTVFTLTIVQKDRITGETITGMLNLVDLAGSERLHKSESTGQRMKEALAINTSLTALGKVIMALDPGSKGSHIPYRDSKLTRLLQNSLGGNSYTALLATLHPQEKHYEESLSTLQFANRCRNVRNQPRVNYIDQGGPDREKRLKKLMQELQTLKRQLSSMEARHQAQVMALMADLGIEGELMPDGRFQTANGEVLGITATAANGAVEESGGVPGSQSELFNATGGSGGARGRSGRGSGARGARALASGKLGGAGLASQLKKQLASESRDKEKFKQKMHAFKYELDSLKEKYEADSDRLNTHVKRQHDQIQNLKEELQELQGGASAQLELERQRHKDEIETVVNNNKILLAKTAERLRDVPKSLHVSSEVLRESRTAAAKMKVQTEAQYNKLIEELNTSHELKLENMRQQYDFLSSKKKAEQEKFVEDFNKYYAKKSNELSEYKNELVMLYNHCNMLSTIVSKVEQNAYPVRQLATGVKVFAIPQKDKPHDIFKDKGRLLHLREQLASSRRAVKRLQKSDKQVMGETMPEINAPNANHARPRRPPSAGNQRQHGRSKQGKADNGGILPPSRENPHNRIPVVNMTQDSYDAPLLYPQIDGSGSMQDVAFGVENPEELEKKSPEDLVDEVMKLRQYIQTGLRKKIEEQVLNDLAGHETIGYIKTLEDERDHYKNELSTSIQRQRALRSSFNAQGRQLNKIRSSGGRARSRPLSATRGFSRGSAHGGFMRPSSASTNRSHR